MGVLVDYDERINTSSESSKNRQSVYYPVDEKNKPLDPVITPVSDEIKNDGNGLDTIYITAAGYIDYPIKGASRDSELAHEEPLWGSDLERSTNGVLVNILDVDYTLVTNINISYKYMNVQDYKALCKIAKERVCRVTYYDRDKAEWVINQEFAFTQRSIGDLYVFGYDYFGALDVSISLVATNRDMVGLFETEFGVIYYAGSGATGSINVLNGDNAKKYSLASWGGNVVIAPHTGLTNGDKKFKYWSTTADDSDGSERYPENSNKTMWNDLELYGIWE